MSVFTQYTPFERIIKDTQIKMPNRSYQGSYYLSLNLKYFLIKNNIIVVDPSMGNEKNIYYKLSPGINLRLDEGVINLIGSEYNVDSNKIHLNHSIAKDGTEKFQIKRTDHKNEDDKEYYWFCKLYDRNRAGAIFKVYLDTETNELCIDNEI